MAISRATKLIKPSDKMHDYLRYRTVEPSALSCSTMRKSLHRIPYIVRTDMGLFYCCRKRDEKEMSLKCDECNGQLTVLETFCTEPYDNGGEWFRDIKKRCICESCGKEHEITVERVKQSKWFK